jgi:hypothetical protein
MSRIQRHVILPSLAPLLFFAVAATPVEALGCRTRGLLAFAIALVSVLAGLGAAIMAIKGRLIIVGIGFLIIGILGLLGLIQWKPGTL